MSSSAAVVNEMAEARRELAGQYGAFANAEELIRAHMASIPPDVRAAAIKPLNLEATKELDRNSIDLPGGHTVVDAVVRGDGIISYVADDGTGRWYKGVQNMPGSVRQSASEESYRQTIEHEAKIREATLDAQADVATKVAEARREAEAESQKELENLRKELAQAQEKLAEKAADEGAQQQSESGGAGTSTRKTSTTRKSSGSRKRSGTRKSGGASRTKSQAAKQQQERNAAEG